MTVISSSSSSSSSPPSSPKAGSSLLHDYLYIQKFLIPVQEEKQFKASVEKYIDYMLNDFGLFFYKATVLEAENASEHFQPTADKLKQKTDKCFAINFYMFTLDHFLESKDTRETCESSQHLEKHFGTKLFDFETGFKSCIFLEQKTYLRRPEFHEIEMPPGTYYGDIEGLNWGLFKSFIYYWLIVPRVQSDFFDIMYQMYNFDLAHQGWIPKFAHFFTIPGNVVFTLAFLHQFKFESVLPFEVNAGLIASLILSTAYIINGFRYKMTAWGFSTSLVIMILYFAAQLFYNTYKVEGNPWYCSTTSIANPLIWMYVSSSLESLSHVIVPQLPPYVTGVNCWHSTIDFFLNGRAFFLCLSVFNALFLAPLVSYLSWPHLIGNMVLCQLFGIGYHEEFYTSYQKMVQKACLSGNPNIDKIPENFNELIHGAPGNSGEKSETTPKIQSLFKLIIGRFSSTPTTTTTTTTTITSTASSSSIEEKITQEVSSEKVSVQEQVEEKKEQIKDVSTVTAVANSTQQDEHEDEDENNHVSKVVEKSGIIKSIDRSQI